MAAEESPDYHSPKRCLALSFRLSRDRWKRKAADRLATIHSMRVRVRDLSLSRDLWKRKAICYQDLLRQAGRLPAADLLPPDDFALAPHLPAEATAAGGEVSVAEAATNSRLAYLSPRDLLLSSLQPSTPPGSLSLPPTPLRPRRQKKNAPGPLLTPDAAARGQHFGLDRICLCLSLLLSGRTSLRSVPRICQVIDADKGLAGQPLPDWTTSRMWLMQLGLAQLRRDVVKADDWFWLVDHSIQLGRDRLMVVFGSRLSEMPPVGQCLRRQDLQLLHLAVMRDPDMHKNHQELLKVKGRTGRPRVLLSDHGADLKGAVRLLSEGLGPLAGMLDIHDIKHRTALALKYRLEDDARWKEFLSQTGKTRNAAKQTEWAFLVPPVLRTKSRYLNLGELVPWAWKTARLVQSPPPAVLEHGTVERLTEKFGWLLDFEGDLKVWNGWYRVAARTEEVVRTRGLYRGVEKNLDVRLSGLVKDEKSREMAGELKAFVREQCARLKEGERVPGSTEVLESCFGTLKQLERDQSRSGFTGLVLGLGALVGDITKEVVANALDSTPEKAVRNWCKENIGMSLQAKRRQAYRLAGVTNPR